MDISDGGTRRLYSSRWAENTGYINNIYVKDRNRFHLVHSTLSTFIAHWSIRISTRTENTRLAAWMSKVNVSVRKWYKRWRRRPCNICCAVNASLQTFIPVVFTCSRPCIAIVAVTSSSRYYRYQIFHWKKYQQSESRHNARSYDTVASDQTLNYIIDIGR